MTPPANIRTLLDALRTAHVTVKVSARAQALDVTWPPALDPARRAHLTDQLRTAKPALLAAAAGQCAWCSTTPRWAHDHDTGWPICRPCARRVGTDRLEHEHPELFPTDQPDRGAA